MSPRRPSSELHQYINRADREQLKALHRQSPVLWAICKSFHTDDQIEEAVNRPTNWLLGETIRLIEEGTIDFSEYGYVPTDPKLLALKRRQWARRKRRMNKSGVDPLDKLKACRSSR